MLPLCVKPKHCVTESKEICSWTFVFNQTRSSSCLWVAKVKVSGEEREDYSYDNDC